MQPHARIEMARMMPLAFFNPAPANFFPELRDPTLSLCHRMHMSRQEYAAPNGAR
jgi:hypothetical protein